MINEGLFITVFNKYATAIIQISGGSRIFQRGGGGDFCKRGMTIHCLITKICELGACFLYFSYMLAQNGG